MATASTETEEKTENLIYSAVLRGGEEDDDVGEVMEVIRAHLDAAARDGRALAIEMRRI
jgi:hypothetical protein